jgi:hypothetical protein
MYLCTLVSADAEAWEPSALIETPVTHAWHNSVIFESEDAEIVVDEYTLHFKHNNDNVSFRSTHLRKGWAFWLPLLSSSLVCVRTVFKDRVSPSTLVAIRLGLNPATDVSVKSIKCECVLENVLKRCRLLYEGMATLHSTKNTMFAGKRKHVDEVPRIIALSADCGLDVLSGCLTTEPGYAINCKTVHVITGHPVSNTIVTAMQQAVLPCLVFTDRPEEYKTSSNTCITSSEFQAGSFFVIKTDRVETICRQRDREMEAMRELLTVVMNAQPSRMQIRRFMWHHFQKAYANARLSVANVRWNTIIVDTQEKGFDLHNDIVHTKQIVIKRHNGIKPMFPTFQEMTTVLQTGTREVCALMAVWSQYVTALEVPKSVLRKIKLRVQPVRPTIAEQRLARAFGRDTAHLSVSDHDHLLLRLTPALLNKADAESLFDHALSMPLSFAQMINGDSVFSASKAFVMTQIHAEHDCGVCHDSCGEQRTVTLCGHSFCRDCSVQLFGEIVRDCKLVTQCPYCRDSVSCGDMVTVCDKVKHVSIQGSKDMWIQSTMRGKTVVINELREAAQFPEQLGDKTTIVVAHTTDVLRLCNALLKYATQTASVKVILLQGSADEEWISKLKCMLS